MESLIIAGTSFSPEINFNAVTHKLEIKGESRPENVKKFYDPVITWLNSYHNWLYYLKNENKQPAQNVEFSLDMEYINSSSIKYIYDLLVSLEKLKDCANLKVYWHYKGMDELMKENGEEYQQMLKGLNMELVEHS